MFCSGDDGPVYYREIQKNAYLKRIPTDSSGKLRPLGHKKPPLRPMWTLFCIHNGRTPFLEQYPEPKATLTHQPSWSVCLKSARHVTASVKPHVGEEYDFLVDTDHGPVRMLAPNWDSMQDWVTILRTKLYELRILSPGENVYCSPPAPPAPRAAARDPTSPLPPTPPIPPDRVPGIDLTPLTRTIEAANERETTTTSNDTSNVTESRNESVTSSTLTPVTLSANSTSLSTVTSLNTTPPAIVTSLSSNLTSLSTVTSLSSNLNDAEVDISNWDSVPLPSTSRDEPKKSVAKICGQNICLDDSVLKRNVTDSDEEFFAEIDRIQEDFEFKQRVVVTEGEQSSSSARNNVTVIQVSNKTPHTAIPVVDNVFDFNFKQKLTIKPEQNDFINIVNTENQNYGTVFLDNDCGHVSLTTVSLTDQMSNGCQNVTCASTNPSDVTSNIKVTDGCGTSNVKVTDVRHSSNVSVTDRGSNVDVNQSSVTDVQANGLYERLCMASTSNRVASPLSVRKLLSENKVRKSSLPNLEVPESAYEYLYPNGSLDVSPANTSIERSQIVPNEGPNTRVVRSLVERSQSQNAYDNTPRQRLQNNSPKREVKQDKTEIQQKPIWKRGLTELSLLSRLRGIGQKVQESPTRQEERVTSSVKVIHRSRPATRDSSRRSTSLNNSQSPPTPVPALQPLRRRQAAALRAEQGRGACVTSVRVRDAPVLCEYEKAVWVARWGSNGFRISGRSGDRIAAIAGTTPSSITQARNLLRNANTMFVDILFHRVPLAKIYVINKMDKESLGMKLDGDCTIASICPESPAARAGLPSGRWAVTEVNNRPVNLIKGGEDDMNRLSYHGTEVSVLIQPSGLVRKMRTAIKGKPLLSMR